MNGKERVLTSLNHRQPDKVPYNIEFTYPAHKKMVDYYGDPDFTSKLGNALSYLGTGRKGGWREAKPGVREDEFGVQWDVSIDRDIGAVCNTKITKETLDDYEFPNPNDPSRFEDYEKLISERNDRFIMADVGFSLFERAWTLAGMETVLMEMVGDPEFIGDLLDRILKYNLGIIENACKYKIDAMRFGDDWGQQTGVMMGPKLWRRFFKPRLAQMYAAVKSKGKYVVIHSCGKVDEIFPDLIEIGVDVFNPFQPEVMDVFEMKRKYGDRLTFWGGISTQRTLPYGTPQQVKDEVRNLLSRVGKNGGYIAAPAHSTPGDARPENIAAMIEVLKEQ